MVKYKSYKTLPLKLILLSIQMFFFKANEVTQIFYESTKTSSGILWTHF